jgi:hypothetical protein
MHCILTRSTTSSSPIPPPTSKNHLTPHQAPLQTLEPLAAKPFLYYRGYFATAEKEALHVGVGRQIQGFGVRKSRCRRGLRRCVTRTRNCLGRSLRLRCHEAWKGMWGEIEGLGIFVGRGFVMEVFVWMVFVVFNRG